MKEGKTDTTLRPTIDWADPAFYDEAALDAEMRRVFDVCHTCRRCIMLCDSFPRLFDLIDGSESGELDTVDSAGIGAVADACTLCDMCYMTSCPYVPPHVYALDFPHLMMRHRAIAEKKGEHGYFEKRLGETDKNGRLAQRLAPLANWASSCKNKLTRPALERIAGVHREAALPRYHVKTFARRAAAEPVTVNAEAPAAGRKAVLYSTCFVEYNNPGIGMAARAVLAKNGVETEIVYPGCCGMPQLERGALGDVAAKAKAISGTLLAWTDKGYDIIALTPSCALMLKMEWPIVLPDHAAIKRVAEHTSDIAEYVVGIARGEGLAEGLQPLEGNIAFHFACHARAQNIGAKAAVMLRMIPKTNVLIMQRCSGHGGSWGVMKENFEVAMKVGESVMKQAAESGRKYVSSECPLAGDHIVQGMERFAEGKPAPAVSHHPIELFAMAYGLCG